MKIIHFCAGLQGWNGMANTARQFVQEELAQGHESLLTNSLEELRRQLEPFLAQAPRSSGSSKVRSSVRVHIHGTWLPVLWKASRVARRAGAEIIVRPAGNYDPIRRRFGLVSRLKKLLAGPWERAMLRRVDILQATCEAEAEWIVDYAGDWIRPKIRLTDLKRFFDLSADGAKADRSEVGRHILYLGRRHPLKGVEYLEEAVRELNSQPPTLDSQPFVLHLVSNKFGDELEREWEWCDVLCLPTLSENFGRVVAEALERGKRVITTDGAPAWGGGNENEKSKMKNEELWRQRLVYLEGYRGGSDARRVELLKSALLAR